MTRHSQRFTLTSSISKASPGTMAAMAPEPAAGGDNADVVIGGGGDDLLFNVEIAVQGVADPGPFLI